MQEDLNEVNKMIKDSIYEESNKVGELVFSNLIPDGPVSFLPESIFRDYFLPRFLGQDQNPKSTWVLEWISVAGSPSAEVGIRDDLTQEHIFTVPPIIYTEGLSLVKNPGDLGDIFSRYKQLNNNLPQEGTSFLFKALHEKNKEMLSKLNLSKPEAQWLSILVRYGVVDPNSENSPQDPVDDMFDYD